MRSVTAKAGTRKEAIQKALGNLDAELHEVKIEILDEGSRGIFGFGSREVEVRVSMEGAEEETPERDGRNNQSQSNERGRRGGGGQRGSRGSGQRDTRRGQGRGGGQDRQGQGRQGQGRQGQDRQGQDRPRRDRETQDRDGRQGQQRQESPEQSERKAPAPRRERPRRPERTTPIDRDAAAAMGKNAAALLNEVITKMGIESKVESALNDNADIILSVESEDSAILIGRKGRNLSAMQFLMNRILLSEEDSDIGCRIIVDVEGYLERHREQLMEMALDLAQRARETGRSMRVKPLTPQDRRIVHLALEGEADIRTFSTGSALQRRVVIVPDNAKDNPNSDQRSRRGPRRRPQQDRGDYNAGSDDSSESEDASGNF